MAVKDLEKEVVISSGVGLFCEEAKKSFTANVRKISKELLAAYCPFCEEDHHISSRRNY